MIIGYLVNLYPAPSHTFIRREIAEVERSGHVVRRYSIRPAPTGLVDRADLAERDRTAVVLGAGAFQIAAALLCALRRPAAFVRALRLAVLVGRRSHRGIPLHLAYLAEACLVLRWCRRDAVEHLHAHFGTNSTAVAMLCRELGGPRYSFTVHGGGHPGLFDAPEFHALDEKVARAAFVVAISDFGRGQLCRWCDPVHWPRIHVVRCGIDEEMLNQVPSPIPAARRLVCIGRVSPEKGHITLLESIRRLSEAGRDFEVVVIGDGPLRPTLETLAARTGVTSKVRFDGWRDGPGVLDAIRAARALVLASFSEGLPVVLMEALALGRPCIATHITGIPELVQTGVTGWLVPAGNEAALASAMAEALDADPRDLEAMGRVGAERVATRHALRAETARLIKLYEKVSRNEAAVADPEQDSARTSNDRGLAR